MITAGRLAPRARPKMTMITAALVAVVQVVAAAALAAGPMEHPRQPEPQAQVAVRAVGMMGDIEAVHEKSP